MAMEQSQSTHVTKMSHNHKINVRTNDSRFHCNLCLHPLTLFQETEQSHSSVRQLAPRNSLTSCYHVLCNACRPKCAESQRPICPVCRKSCVLKYITEDMTPRLLLMFKPLSESMKMVMNIKKFQQEHQDSIINAFSKRRHIYRKKLEQKIQEMDTFRQTYPAENMERIKLKNFLKVFLEEGKRYELFHIRKISFQYFDFGLNWICFLCFVFFSIDVGCVADFRDSKQ